MAANGATEQDGSSSIEPHHCDGRFIEHVQGAQLGATLRAEAESRPTAALVLKQGASEHALRTLTQLHAVKVDVRQTGIGTKPRG